jgi:hypothetical protein
VPSIAGKGSKIRRSTASAGANCQTAEIKQWITDPDAMTAKMPEEARVKMKKEDLPAADVDNLVEYMLS